MGRRGLFTRWVEDNRFFIWYLGKSWQSCLEIKYDRKRLSSRLNKSREYYCFRNFDLVWDSLQSIKFLAKLVVYTANFLSLWEALVIHTGLTWIIKKYSHLISLEIVYET